MYKLKIDEYTLRRRNVTAQPTEYMKKVMGEYKDTAAVKKAITAAKKEEDIFQSEFANEKKDSTAAGKEVTGTIAKYDVLKTIKKFRYKPPKFSVDYGSAGFASGVLINRYQAYGGGAGPIQLNSGTPLSGLIRLGTTELMEDVKITGGFKISTNLKDNEWLMSYQNYKRRFDWGATYYRNVVSVAYGIFDSTGQVQPYPGKIFTNLYQVNVSYPFDRSKSIRLTTGIRSDKQVLSANKNFPPTVGAADQKTLYSTTKLEYIYDNSMNPAMNIWNGLRYKIYFDYNRQINKVQFADGPSTFNVGFDARYYYPIHRNFIWAGRAAGDFSWGNQKLIYYLGGVDGWLMFGQNNRNGKERYFNSANQPAADQNYAFESLAVNMRGFIQNVANGNNAVVINSEFRLPVVSTFFNRTLNNSFLNNFQIVQFIDLGTAWNGAYSGIKRPVSRYNLLPNGQQGPLTVTVKAGGIGPFAGGYGFGARSTLLGYFIKYDVAWPMNVFFKGKPVMYFALGFDF